MTKTCLVLNEAFSDNLGDNLIAYAMAQALTNAGFQVVGVDFSGRSTASRRDSKSLKRPLFYRVLQQLLPSFLRFLLKNFFTILRESVKRYSVVVIGGGQLILDNPVFPNACFFWVIMSRLFGSEVIVFAVGVGDEFSWLSKLKFALALKLVRCVYVRDRHSQENLFRLYGVKADVVPDIAYAVNVDVNSGPRDYVICSPTDFEVHRRYAQELGAMPINLLDYEKIWVSWLSRHLEIGDRVIICSTTLSDHQFAAQLLRNHAGLESVELIDCGTWQDFLQTSLRAKVVFSGRMHALIMAHLAGAIVEPFVVSNKIKAFQSEYLSSSPKQHNDLVNQIVRRLAD